MINTVDLGIDDCLWGDQHCWSWGSTIASEVITSEAITLLILGASTIASEAVNAEAIIFEATVDPGGGSMIDIEVIDDQHRANWWLTQTGSTQNSIVGIARCIMVILSPAPVSLRHTVFHLLCEIWDILAEKQRQQVSIQLFSQNWALLWMLNVLRATCKRNKLNLLNSTWKMVKVDCWSSLCWSFIPHPPFLPHKSSSGSFVTLHVHFV